MRFLVVAPHPDDAELGMGGTIIKLISQGHAVHLLDMTNGEPTPNGSPEIREREWTAATKLLGCTRSNLGLKNREVTHDLASRYKLAAVIREHRPSTIFIPYSPDAHPDHVAVTRIAEDARFDAKLSKTNIPGEPWHPKRIIYYFCTHLRLSFQPTFCIDTSDTHQKKLEACACYESQGLSKDGGLISLVDQVSAYFGNRIGTKFAEPFFSHEVIGLAGLDELV
ncbi:MAG TPA: PIG-L family deacetylase [Tepidisphaeraceae bacterium]|nr:PIG-L family deacetylase [Tepidisphaeraceae bacterium]